MALTENGALSAADVAAVTRGGNGNYGGWGDGSFWLLILFLFAFTGNGFGGYGGNGMGGEVQRGFDQQAVMGGINGLTSAMNANQMATMTAMNSLAMSLQQCCCENRASTADVKYTVANEAAATRAAVQSGNQAILDKLCQLELDGIKQNYENRIASMQNALDQARSENQALKFQSSQGAQTSQILADNARQTVALEQYLNPTPVPAYVVQNPNCCGPTYGSCGCGA